MGKYLVAVFSALFFLFSSIAYGVSLEFYDGDTFSVSDESELTISYSGVDDIIATFVLNKSTARKLENGGEWTPVEMAQWSSNPGPSGTWEISDNIRSGANIVFVAVHNLVYTGFCLGKCGKVSWAYKIKCKDTTLNYSSKEKRVNHNHLAHLFAVKVIKDNDSDKFFITELSDEEEDLVDTLSDYIEAYLGQQGTTDVDWGEVLENID